MLLILFCVIAALGAIHKIRPQSGGCLVQTRRVLQVRTSELFGAKTLDFFEIYGVSARTSRGLSQCGQGGGEEGSQFFGMCFMNQKYIKET